MLNKQDIYNILDENKIAYTVVDHPAVFSGDAMDTMDIPGIEKVIKNLFLRDAKGKNYFLVVLSLHKKANLDKIRGWLGSSRLGFASEERLMEYLEITPGSVSPLCILNGKAENVKVVFDKELLGFDCIGMHPCDNTASVFMKLSDVISLIEDKAKEILYLEI